MRQLYTINKNMKELAYVLLTRDRYESRLLSWAKAHIETIN